MNLIKKIAYCINRRVVFSIIGMLFSFFSFSQCFVQNGGFENYRNCDSKFLDSNVIYWDNAYSKDSNILASNTPDFYNECFNPQGGCWVSYCIPENGNSTMLTHSGKGYAGLVITIGPNAGYFYREYIQNTFSDSLVAQKCYHFRMYCAVADKSKFLSPTIGVYFSDTLLALKVPSNFLNSIIYLQPQIQNDTNNYSLSDWFLVEGYYTAKGGERYITIGNFYEDSSTKLTLINNTGYSSAYMLIDDVSLVACDEEIIGSEQLEVCAGDSVQLMKEPLHSHAYCNWYNQKHTPLHSGFAWWFTPTQDTVLYTIRGDSLSTCDLRYDSIIIRLKKCDTIDPPHPDTLLKIALPTAFTPNGDGQNETFYPIGNKSFALSKFTIYNRWGEIVHNAPQPWDGKYKNEAQPQDAYWFIIEYEGKINKGVVTLLR